MIDDNIFDEMNLPLANFKETLNHSENHLKPLFDVTKFVIRWKQERDKGIDFQIEIKNKNRFTNFHFAIQLKATDSKIANKDGSISVQLDTGNINYLLNNPMPAFYILYFKSTNTFYYENIRDFAKTLYEKDSNWNKQGSHILRFTKILDSFGFNEIYIATLKKGKFQRIINENTVRQAVTANLVDKIIIDADFNVTNDREIETMIESIGLEIINEGNWKKIIFLHKKASGTIASTSKYNLVLGIANYYSGNLLEALSFFKTAINLKTRLKTCKIIFFFEISVKFSIGLITVDEYEKRMQKLQNTDNVGFYIRLEKAKRDYIDSINKKANDQFEIYQSEVNSIINNPKANQSIKLNAKCELILFEGMKITLIILQVFQL